MKVWATILMGGWLSVYCQTPLEQAEFFEKRIRPVLAEKCYPCHSAQLKTPMGGLRLDSRAGALKGGDSGPAIVPGAPDQSLLLKALSYQDLRLKMPPTGKLPDEQIADFSSWIQMGASETHSDAAPRAETKRGIDFDRERNYWAFRPVQDPLPPAVKNKDWVTSPIDRFILAKLEEKGLKPAPPADKRSLIRRVTFDLTGLPPAPDEIADFLNDQSPHGFEKVVDRLLASPHYGERWARHWMDLVRFAETNGHEFDNDKVDAWRYRDYLIRAFNQDVPYNQLIKEHIAGDLLPSKRISPDGSQWESPVGTSFYWFGEVLNSATDSVKSRADEVDNQIDVASKAFLGLTVACARCHDHKFDPVPTTDYYALAGILHSTDIHEAVIDSPSRAREIAAVRQNVKAFTRPPPVQPRSGDIVFDEFTSWRVDGQAFGDFPVQGAANSLAAGSDKFVGSLTSAKFPMPKTYVHVRLAGTKADAQLKEKGDLRFTIVADGYKSQHLAPDGTGLFHWKTLRMTLERGRICYFEIVDRSREGHIVVDKIVLSDFQDPPAGDELPAQADAAEVDVRVPESAFATIAADRDPHNVRVHIRGNHNNPGEEVPRRFPRIIAGEQQPAIKNGSGRLEMAEWMASPRNPLAARVAVNRIWQHHFGHGIVRSTDNFGKTGEPPTHPELLDYLATRFIESGWSVKAMHRMMVLSSVYRMSSRTGENAAPVDPQNRLLHHMPVRRLEAEAIRDAILALSGRLDRRMFGPSVPPHISPHQDGRGKPKSGPIDGDGRRSIYIQVRRNFLTPMFLAFDYPPPISAIGARGVSTVPTQALLMMNNEFVTAHADLWARRALARAAGPEARLTWMFETAFGRPPEPWELRETMQFVASQSWADLAHVLFNSAEFIYIR